MVNCMWNTLESSDKKDGISFTSCYTSATWISAAKKVALCSFTDDRQKQPLKNVINFG